MQGGRWSSVLCRASSPESRGGEESRLRKAQNQPRLSSLSVDSRKLLLRLLRPAGLLLCVVCCVVFGYVGSCSVFGRSVVGLGLLGVALGRRRGARGQEGAVKFHNVLLYAPHRAGGAEGTGNTMMTMMTIISPTLLSYHEIALNSLILTARPHTQPRAGRRGM